MSYFERGPEPGKSNCASMPYFYGDYPETNRDRGFVGGIHTIYGKIFSGNTGFV